MADFGEIHHVTGRKPHRCEMCFGVIPKGESHAHFKGMWQGEWQNWRMHEECYDASDKQEIYIDGFTPGEGEKPERIKLLEAQP